MGRAAALRVVHRQARSVSEGKETCDQALAAVGLVGDVRGQAFEPPHGAADGQANVTVGRGVRDISEATIMGDIRQTEECAPVRQRDPRSGPTSRHNAVRGARSAVAEMGIPTYRFKTVCEEVFLCTYLSRISDEQQPSNQFRTI